MENEHVNSEPTSDLRSVLYASVVSVNAILNDGVTPNRITLRVSNVSDQTLSFGEGAELYLYVDMGPTTEAHTLATEGQVHGFQVAIDDIRRWQVHAKPTVNSPIAWSIAPKDASVELAPRAGIELTISCIVTGHPSGGTNIYLRYRKVGGHDGLLIVPIEKTQLVSEQRGGHQENTATKKIVYDAAYLLEVDEAARAALRKRKATEAFAKAEAKRAAQRKAASEAKQTAARIQAIQASDTTDLVHVCQMGNEGFVDLGTGVQLNTPFTIEAWIYTCYNGYYHFILTAKNENDRRGPFFQVTNNRGLEFSFEYETNSWTSIYEQNIIPDNAWCHVACTFDGHQARLFVNGDCKKQTGLASMAPNLQPLSIIGTNVDGSGFHFYGRLAEIRIWNSVRTGQQLQASMHTRLTGNEEHLAGYWPLNVVEKGVTRDYSSGGCHGKVQDDLTITQEGTSSLNLCSPAIPELLPVEPPPTPPITELAKTGPLDFFAAPVVDEPEFLAPAVGVIVRSEQCWHSQGVVPGQLVYSTGLAPGEQTTITVQNTGVQRDLLQEVGNVVADETRAHALAGSRQCTLTRGLPTPQAHHVRGARGLAQQLNRGIATRTRQQVNRVHAQPPTVTEVASSDGSSRRIVTNPDSKHALSAQYFEALQQFLVVTRATHYERLLFVPLKTLQRQDPRVSERFQQALRAMGQRLQTTGTQVLPTQCTQSEVTGEDASANGFVTLHIAGNPVHTIPMLRPRLTKLTWKFVANEDDEFWFQSTTVEGDQDAGREKPAVTTFWLGNNDADGKLNKTVEVNVPQPQQANWRELAVDFPEVPLWQSTSLGSNFHIRPRFFRNQAPGSASLVGDGNYANYDLNGEWSCFELPGNYVAVEMGIADRVKLVFNSRIRHVPPLAPRSTPTLEITQSTGSLQAVGGFHGPYDVWLLRKNDPRPKLEVTLHFSDGLQETSFSHTVDYSASWMADDVPMFEFRAAGATSEVCDSNRDAGHQSLAKPTLNPLDVAGDSLFASHLVWTNTPAHDWRRRLDGLTYQGLALGDMVDPTPAAVLDNYVGFRWSFADELEKLDWLLSMQLLDQNFRVWLQDHGYADTDVDLTRASRALKRDYLDKGLPLGDEGLHEETVSVATGGLVADTTTCPTPGTTADDD